VEGGSANDYDYVAGDPVNCLDLDGNLSYTFNHNLGRSVLTPELFMRWVAYLFGRLFPVKGAPERLRLGQRIGLSYAGVPGPVTVSRMDPTGGGLVLG